MAPFRARLGEPSKPWQVKLAGALGAKNLIPHTSIHDAGCLAALGARLRRPKMASTNPTHSGAVRP